LYASLRVPGGAPVPAETVLARFLRALRLDGGTVPDSLEERTQLFRTWCADRVVLVLLDDAVSTSQVQPLLPGGGRCAVIVTSCHQLAGVAAADTVELAGLPRPESVEFLGAVAGGAEALGPWADPIARLCDDLPLTLRAAGTLLSTGSRCRPELLAERLANEDNRLRELGVPELDLRARLADIRGDLSEAASRAFPILGSLEVGGFTARQAAKRLRVSDEVAKRILDELVDCHLLMVRWPTRPGRPSRYWFIDLIRLYARHLLPPRRPVMQRPVMHLRRVTARRPAVAVIR
jgi:hypothetical protein